MFGSPPAALAPRPRRQPRRCAPLPTCGQADQHIHEHRRRILEYAVAPAFAVAKATLWQPTRGSPREAFARQAAMYLAHVSLGLSQRTVGVLFARDRSTVAHACALIEDRRDAAPFDRALDLLEGALRLLSARRA